MIRDLLLVFSWKVDEVIIFGADQEWNSGLVETSSLSVPLLDTVECALPCQIEHEQDSHSIVAH